VDIFRKRGRGFSDVDVRIFGAKNIGFFEIYFVEYPQSVVKHERTDVEELSKCRHFADKEVMFIFRNFARTSSMDVPLLFVVFCVDLAQLSAVS